MRSYRIAQQTAGPVFFDRGIPDCLGYLRLLHAPLPTHLQKAAKMFRYNRRVFIAPPWREIFAQDAERKQDFAEAVRTYEAMAATYADYHYELVEIPRLPIKERVEFVLRSVGSSGGRLY